MAFLSLYTRRQLPQVVSRFAGLTRIAQTPPRHLLTGGSPARRLHGHGPVRSHAGEKGPWGKSRAPEQLHQHPLTELDRADAMMLRKSHETGFLSWFRNGLLATGIGVIAFVQSDVGREAGYAFFLLGGLCVSFGGASYMVSLFSLRRMLLLSLPAVLLHGAVVGTVALFWLCAVSLYIGRLEVEIIHEGEEDDDDDDDGGGGDDECRECRDRRENRGYHGSHDHRRHAKEDSHNKGQDK